MDAERANRRTCRSNDSTRSLVLPPKTETGGAPGRHQKAFRFAARVRQGSAWEDEVH
jgi:hypothetical protein